MMKRLFIHFLVYSFLLLPSLVSAQDTASGDLFSESLQDAWIIMGTTVGGAILGLSTLSFMEEPSKHLRNITVGGAMGIIIGVGIVAVSQAGKGRELYETGESSPKFDTVDRLAWHNLSIESKTQDLEVPYFTYSLNF